MRSSSQTLHLLYLSSHVFTLDIEVTAFYALFVVLCVFFLKLKMISAHSCQLVADSLYSFLFCSVGDDPQCSRQRSAPHVTEVRAVQRAL